MFLPEVCHENNGYSIAWMIWCPLGNRVFLICRIQYESWVFRIRPVANLCIINRIMGLLGGSPRHSIAAVFLCDRGNHRYVKVVLQSVECGLILRKGDFSSLSTVAFATLRLNLVPGAVWDNSYDVPTWLPVSRVLPQEISETIGRPFLSFEPVRERSLGCRQMLGLR